MKVEFPDIKLFNVSPLIANYSYDVKRVNKTTQMFAAELIFKPDVVLDSVVVGFTFNSWLFLQNLEASFF